MPGYSFWAFRRGALNHTIFGQTAQSFRTWNGSAKAEPSAGARRELQTRRRLGRQNAGPNRYRQDGEQQNKWVAEFRYRRSLSLRGGGPLQFKAPTAQARFAWFGLTALAGFTGRSPAEPYPRFHGLQTAMRPMSTMNAAAEIEKHRKWLLGYALSIAKNRDDAEDIVSQFTVRALTTTAPWDGVSPFRIWAARVMRNLCTDNYRTAHARQEFHSLQEQTEGGDEYSEIVGDGIDYEARIADRDEIRQCLGSLSMAELTLIKASFAGITLREIGDMYRLPLGTVKSRLSRLQERMRNARAVR